MDPLKANPGDDETEEEERDDMLDLNLSLLTTLVVSF